MTSIYHYHVPKTGGTSLNIAFLALAGEDPWWVYSRLSAANPHEIRIADKVFIAWDPWRVQHYPFFYGFSHQPAYEMSFPRRVRTVTVLRDPLDRLRSQYAELLFYKVERIQHPVMRRQGKYVKDTFEGFVEALPPELRLGQIAMFSPSNDPSEALQFLRDHEVIVGFTEQLGALFAQLQLYYGLRLSLRHDRRASIDVEVTPETRQCLRTELLADEYQFWEEAHQVYPEANHA